MGTKKDTGEENIYDELTLEEAMERLEETLRAMDAEDITLEESLKSYEAGVRLVKKCRDEIDRAEKKLIQLNPETGEEV